MRHIKAERQALVHGNAGHTHAGHIGAGQVLPSLLVLRGRVRPISANTDTGNAGRFRGAQCLVASHGGDVLGHCAEIRLTSTGDKAGNTKIGRTGKDRDRTEAQR